jgi:hypothetical protein
VAFITGIVRRFFHPSAIDEMLSVFVPMLNGTDLDVCIYVSCENTNSFILFHYVEFTLITILHVNFSSAKPSSVLSTYAFPRVGIRQFVHV